MLVILTLCGSLHAQGEPSFRYPPTARGDASSVERWQDIVVLDQFFLPDVYYQLDEDGEVDGALVGRPGRRLARGDVGVIAVDFLEQAAKYAGVPSRDVSTAMLDGRLNPYFEDVLLAYEGLAPDGSLTEHDLSPGRLAHLRELGLAPSEGLPDVLYLRGEYLGTRNERWNERFGSLDFPGPVQTFAGGERRAMTRMDLALRMLQRSRASSFQREYGLDLDPELTYAGATARLDASRASQLAEELGDILARESAVSYFRMGALEPSAFNFAEDYKQLREQSYLPRLAQAHLASVRTAGAPRSSDASPDERCAELMLRTISRAAMIADGDQRKEAEVLAALDTSSCPEDLRRAYEQLTRDLRTGDAARNQGEAFRAVLEQIYAVVGREDALRIMKASRDAVADGDRPTDARPSKPRPAPAVPNPASPAPASPPRDVEPKVATAETPKPQPPSGAVADDSIESIKQAILFLQQQVLSEFEVDGLSASGTWDFASHVGVTSYLRSLQESTGLGPQPADGRYTPEFRSELVAWLTEMDPSHDAVQAIRRVQASLDALTARGIYHPDRRPVRAGVTVKVVEDTAPPTLPVTAPTTVPDEPVGDTRPVYFDPTNHEYIATLALVTANAFFWEWGDEFLGMFLERYRGSAAADRFRDNVPRYVDAFIDQYPKSYWIATALGTWLSLGGLIALIYARSKGGGLVLGFLYGCAAEAIETVFSYFGEAHTFGSADFGELMKFARWSVPITGISVGWLSQLNGPKKSVYGTEGVWTAGLLGLVYLMFFRYGALQ